MGYSVTLAATTGATAPSQAGIVSATEIGIQVWFKAAKLRSAIATPKDVVMWLSALPISGATLKVGFFVAGNDTGSGGISCTPYIYTPGFADYFAITDASGNPIDISSLVNTDDVVIYMGYAPTTGTTPQEVSLFLESGTQVGATMAKNYSAAALTTTASQGATLLNFEQTVGFSNREAAGTYKRVAIWNKGLTGAARYTIPVGNESGLVSLWGNANGFTVGSGTTEPNQVSGGSTLTLDASVTWNNLGGGPPPASVVFRSFRMHRGRK